MARIHAFPSVAEETGEKLRMARKMEDANRFVSHDTFNLNLHHSLKNVESEEQHLTWNINFSSFNFSS